MSEGQSAGINRRRVLQGAAWTAPAILIATAAPARAVSLDPAVGITFTSFVPQFTHYFWNATANENINAVTVSVYLQNVPPLTSPASPAVSITYTVVVPVGTIAAPRWGLGTNSEGIPSYVPITMVGEPQVADGLATLTFQWAGSLPVYGGGYIMVWTEADANQLGKLAGAQALAIHQSGDTSQDSASGQTVFITDVDQWHGYFFAYSGPLPPAEFSGP